MPRAAFQVFGLPFRGQRARVFEYAIFKRADEGYWQAIAGGGEDGESPVEAAKREAFEEANIPASASFFKLKTTASVPVSEFKARRLWPRDQYVVPGHYFAIESSEIEIALSYEHSEHRWVEYVEGERLLHWDNDKTALWELDQRLLNDDLPSPA